MSIISDYKKIGFSRDLVYLYSGKLFLDFGSNVLSLFLPIFLYQQFQSINLVILYFIFGSLLYVLTLPLSAKLLGPLGVKNSLIIAVIFRIIYFGAFYKFTSDPWIYLTIALMTSFLMRDFFGYPFM